MTKKEKIEKSILVGGIGANVIDGDLHFAIQIWKRELKDTGLLIDWKRSRTYIKPSERRRKIVEKAKYKNKIQNF